MQYFLFLILILALSACSTTPEVSSSSENDTKQKILSNQSEALHAQAEYKKLQATREKE